MTLPSLSARGINVAPAALEAALVDALSLRKPYRYPMRSGLSPAEQEVLKVGGVDLEKHDFGMEDPVVQATVEHAEIVVTSMSTTEAAACLGISRERVWQRLKNGSLFGIQTATGWRLPAFQFTDAGELPGWGEVAKALPEGLSPVELKAWLEGPHPDLGNASPRAWLLAGGAPRTLVPLLDAFEIP